MGNPFIPLPRIENALIIGDKAAECLQLNFCIRRRSIWNALLAKVQLQTLRRFIADDESIFNSGQWDEWIPHNIILL